MIQYFASGDTPLLLEHATEVDVTYTIGPDRVMHVQEAGFYVVFEGEAVTGGAVAIETAHDRGYRGKWALLETVAYRTPDRTHYVGIPGVHLALRVRVVEPIIGGTVSVYGIGKT